MAAFATACSTSDSALKEQGHSEAYVVGFHDGRHSGMQEAGNSWEHYIRDHERFEADLDYKEGWLAGEAEGKRLQAQATAAGEAAAGAYTGYRVKEETDKAMPHPNKIGKEVVKDVDTDALKSLEK
ncbi:hypothetical protein C0039_20400 [Pseudohalioglobus lutimaris]|uniref:Lipoprotein n=2 Tax=Pseudohalioglobus lutimaris TaxID=1737061 RepID=A0A2N5WWW8_9GAMM|nr:hypothetical protein C0039_20400 [Pseudohalioglobus lutimaris]